MTPPVHRTGTGHAPRTDSAQAIEPKPKPKPRVRQNRAGAVEDGIEGGGTAAKPKPKRTAKQEPTPATHPRLFTKGGVRRAHTPPKGVKVHRNKGNGSYIEWYWLQNNGEPVVDDENNRVKGYIYARADVKRRATEKFAKNREIATVLPGIREQLEADIAGGSKRSVLAACVALIDHCYIRVGNRTSATKRENYGATTLQRQHLVEIEGSHIYLDYRGKSYVHHLEHLRSWTLAEKLGVLRDACRNETSPLFACEGEPISAAMVNQYLADLSRKVGLTFEMSAKDFRSYHATRMARRYLLRCRSAPPERREEILTRMYAWVGEQLGHEKGTGTAKKHYVDPVVAHQFMKGRLRGKLSCNPSRV